MVGRYHAEPCVKRNLDLQYIELPTVGEATAAKDDAFLWQEDTMSRRDPSEDWHESCVFGMRITQTSHAIPKHPVEH